MKKITKSFIKFRSKKAKKTLLENKTKSIFSAFWINFALYKSTLSYMWTNKIQNWAQRQLNRHSIESVIEKTQSCGCKKFLKWIQNKRESF